MAPLGSADRTLRHPSPSLLKALLCRLLQSLACFTAARVATRVADERESNGASTQLPAQPLQSPRVLNAASLLLPAVIGVFPGGESGDGFEAYKSAANTLRSDYDFAHVTDASFLEEAKGELLHSLHSLSEN